MSEDIKPDLVLPLKRKWFAEIWNGEKRTEYRAVKPYWTKRIGSWLFDGTPRFIMFQIGYAKVGPRLFVQTTGIDVVQPCVFCEGVYYPLADMPRMKEKEGAK